jgi:hypothetical protein
MGAAGRRAFDAGLSYERQADRLTSLYAEVLGGRSAGRRQGASPMPRNPTRKAENG